MHTFRLLLLLVPLGALTACSGGGGIREIAVAIPFSAANFLGSPVDNPYFPLRPGSKFHYEGDTADGRVVIDVEVTTLTRDVFGVTCVVAIFTETIDGELAEIAEDWFAQDREGNVWYFGEVSNEYENGVVVSTAGSWEAGVNGAEPGIVMLGAPGLGMRYAQEKAPGVAEDMAKVVGAGSAVTTPLATFRGCLKTEDWNPLDPGSLENKFYAPGIGTVLEVEKDGSRIELLRVEYNPPFNPLSFVPGVDHPLFPLVPGTTYTYEKDTADGLETTEVEVLHATKVILGVTCVVVRDIVTLDGDLVEDTLDWFAQDVFGNVWYLGEESKDYENGVLVSTEGSWEAGVDGAVAGIIMLASPIIGIAYRQEFYAGVAEDMGAVEALRETVTVPFGTFTDCLKTRDFTPLEPGVAERKYYARGVGRILETNDDGERAELISVATE